MNLPTRPDRLLSTASGTRRLGLVYQSLDLLSFAKPFDPIPNWLLV